MIAVLPLLLHWSGARRAACILLVLAAWVLPAADSASVALSPNLALDPARIRADAEMLSAIPQRAQGCAGAATAADLIDRRLRELGLQVLRTTHEVLVPVDHGSSVTLADGHVIAATPLPANGAALPGTRGRSLSGPLFRGRSGTMTELAGCPPGAVVVLDSTSRDGWTHAAQIGAIAVIISGGSGEVAIDQEHLQGLSVSASIDFPRLFADLPATATGTVTVRGDMRWEARHADSVIAVIPGRSNPAQAVIIAAGYEANGAMANPGALRAWNAALLLDLSRILSREPAERTVIVVFHGARAEAARGLREILAALMNDRKDDVITRKSDNDQLLQFRNHALNQMRAASAAQLAFARTLADQCGEPLRATWAAAMADCERERADFSDKLIATDQNRVTALPARIVSLAVADHADQTQLALNRLRDEINPKGATHARSAVDGERLRSAQQEQIAWRSVQLKLESDRPLTASEARLAMRVIPAAMNVAAAQARHHHRRWTEFSGLLNLRTALSATVPVQTIALDFSDGHTRWAAYGAGFTQQGVANTRNPLRKLHSLAGEAFRLIRRTVADSAGDPTPHQRADDLATWWPAEWYHDSGQIGFAMYGLTLATHSDDRRRSGTPADTIAALNFSRLDAQLAGLLPFVRLWSDSAEWNDRSAWRQRYENGAFKSISVAQRQLAVGAKSGERGVAFPTTFLLMGGAAWSGDMQTYETREGDLFGTAWLPFLPAKRTDEGKNMQVRGYRFAPDGGISGIMCQPDRNRQGDPISIELETGTKNIGARVTAVEPGFVLGVFEPRLLTPLPVIRPLIASRESPPNYWRVEIAGAHIGVFTEALPKRILGGADKLGSRFILRGATTAGAAGSLISGPLAGLTAYDAALSMWQLDDERIALNRKSGIEADAQVAVHAKAQQHLERARAALEQRDYAQAQAQAQSSWALSARVYPKVLSTANDVVFGLVILLLFTLPFALIVERLLIAGATINRKVAGFGGVFAVTFLFFYFFHPGFALATTPTVIFLAFLIMLASGWVIVVIGQRFELEMQLIRRHGAGVHAADVSRLGTLVATVGLGISNMRRRPIRTLLTWLTVCLMTFILLTFASFNSASGVARLSIDAPPAFTGILIRQNGWGPLSEGTLDRVQSRWGSSASISTLRWLQPSELARVRGFPITTTSGKTTVPAGIIGIDHRDPTALAQACVRPAYSPSASAADQGKPEPALNKAPLLTGFSGASDWIFLAPDLIKELGVRPGDTVRLRGVPLRVGTLDVNAAASAMTLGGELQTPLAPDTLDPAQQDAVKRLETGDTAGAGAIESTSPIHLDPETCAVVHSSVLRAFAAPLRALNVVPPADGIDPDRLAVDIAQELGLTIRVGAANETQMLTAVDRLSVAGLGAVLVPLILGGLIIFSTMLNSVAERGREIFVYASLGLAPIHVAALFLVEAGIYAVIGGLGGYLMAQLIVAGLGLAAGFGWVAQPDLNYSSFTAVATILLVMATVLASALYPAWLASRAATPGGTTTFRLPPPVGDTIACDFPFTVPTPDAHGMAAFLADHFAAHSESSAGSFTAADAVMVPGKEPQVSARIWLAPFDLGISQRATIRFTPSDMRGIMKVVLRLDLLSGQRGDWLRVNTAFMRDLRLQFLVWRTLPAAVQARYHAPTAAAVDGLATATTDIPFAALPNAMLGAVPSTMPLTAPDAVTDVMAEPVTGILPQDHDGPDHVVRP